MTEVVFHFNVADKLAYACRLLRKAYARGVRVWVTAEEPALAKLDQLLWTFTALEFVPHCRENAKPLTRSSTPIFLATSVPDDAQVADQVLVNLGALVPQGFERFARCIEVVGSAPDDRAVARQRWKHYESQGLTCKQHDVVATAESAG